ncbi:MULTISPECIES: GGDEF and EAL domain-containing protein [unclassified Agrobacterium]|jgi:diguanylate cyclase (GGDEF)-like protein|uniref:putative bifunctional diguanylate cyclase/phosphodiesterase n=1 Tax=unclassified Agrobacterium TaxID=2632611 RepID=UPI0024494C58|nr:MULTISPECIES: GGDEF and EAL domain-containing protein [unclassified Agrobacterium]MDH0616727.1 GGDEF and EAL domain-containing protein [Agrobacterium sp. GD03872]MDH0699358.1 GGDEF and EAL domain-containing protein [Agrobacterium sp. GD03871]MDH1062118.1 GGDEF and EAL domain-containing protein [Agrobacterium sp. GD03992]MDH2213630.1 GGDEF and EAL domain-containing protein [Agrobacterium sp. GD03643]MDH2222313.1 GGDEF and EAL domain-containing protein [Agrobacterium sp. GD03638]
MKHTLGEAGGQQDYRRPDSRFSDELLALYQQEGERSRRGSIRRGLWTAVLIYLLFAASDIILIPDVAFYTILARFTVVLSSLLTLEIQLRKGASTAALDLTCATALVMGYIGWLVPSLFTDNIENMSYYMVFGAIFMMGANLFFTFRFHLSLVSSGIILVTYFLAATQFPEDAFYKFAFGTFYLSCFIFTSYVNWNLNRERYHVFVNGLEAKAQQKAADERGQALLRLSNTDSLTGLQNRRAIDHHLRLLWDNWSKKKEGFAVFLIDVDFFKKYNDRYGHQEGDKCLVTVGNALQDAIIDHGASIGRYGGEEFIVLAPFKSKQQVGDLAETIRHTVENLSLAHDQRRDGTFIVTVSIGASFTRPNPDGKLEKIINEADRALYIAKGNGRNCMKLFDPEDPQTSDETENIAALLKIAIAENLVSLVYQPILNISTNETAGVEALMRLRLLDGSPVAPGIFIPIAERTGTIMELGLWTIKTVCKQILADDKVAVVSVNVSPMQLKNPGFATSVAAILVEAGIAGNRLAFEITEGVDMEMHSDVLRCLNDLKTLGINIWLDDFGTGFAGLSWLRMTDFDTVKIDRSFLHDSKTPRGRAMLQDMIRLIRNRGHKILIEGVETEEQLRLVRQMEIDYAQGYYIGRPVMAERLGATATPYPRPNMLLRPA